jgi:hypothetical protein
MMEKFEPGDIKDPKWQSLASSKTFKGFLHDIANKQTGFTPALRQVAVGLLIWTDGWDPSTGCKSNRSPMHTGTLSLLVVDVGSSMVVGVCTYPNMGGPGKIDHEPVFRRLQEDIAAFESDGSDRAIRHFRWSPHKCCLLSGSTGKRTASRLWWAQSPLLECRVTSKRAFGCIQD